MGQRIVFVASSIVMLLAAISTARADDAAFSKDLMATIALQGKQCDKLIKVKRNGDSDYSVACKDGHRYHIYVNSQGRVIVENQ